ncbi:LysR substrate-binding domain-containing protein [Lederbergia citri]|uniref:LysR family transcriptional regulator n=1 Tax=Lederbergia citri TaxID=2833580 RepID=A0A942YK95_9BACI|nr:LysR substrate-binding domain-containing protein [Lederbergia citri]MBS4197121.1 LysR family transcriptional regulator [Lederbergia citri]
MYLFFPAHRSIAVLEDELGVSLFERNGRNIFLNQYGRIFLERATAALNEIEKGKQEITSMINPSSGVISLGFLHMLGVDLIPSLLSSFRKQYPDIQFELQQCTNHELMAHILNGDHDFGITTPELVTNSCLWHLLLKADLFLAVPNNHKWAEKSSISLDEIHNESYIGLKQSCGIGFTVNKLFEDKQIKPDIVLQADELDTVAGLVSAGFGVALLPKTRALLNHPLVWLKVTEPACEVSIGLVWKEERPLTPVAKSFLEFIRNQYPLIDNN